MGTPTGRFGALATVEAAGPGRVGGVTAVHRSWRRNRRWEGEGEEGGHRRRGRAWPELRGGAVGGGRGEFSGGVGKSYGRKMNRGARWGVG